MGAGVQAEHYRGKVAGLYEDRLKLQIGPTDEAIVAQIASLLGPDMARAIGEGLGLEGPPPGESSRLIEYQGETDEEHDRATG